MIKGLTGLWKLGFLSPGCDHPGASGGFPPPPSIPLLPPPLFSHGGAPPLRRCCCGQDERPPEEDGLQVRTRDPEPPLALPLRSRLPSGFLQEVSVPWAVGVRRSGSREAGAAERICPAGGRVHPRLPGDARDRDAAGCQLKLRTGGIPQAEPDLWNAASFRMQMRFNRPGRKKNKPVVETFPRLYAGARCHGNTETARELPVKEERR